MGHCSREERGWSEQLTALKASSWKDTCPVGFIGMSNPHDSPDSRGGGDVKSYPVPGKQVSAKGNSSNDDHSCALCGRHDLRLSILEHLQADSLPAEAPRKPKNNGVGSLSLLQGTLPYPGIEPGSPALQAASLPAELPGKPMHLC